MPEKSPVISVIIPLYNKGRHIARTLDSVLNQSFLDFEVIVVDDGSTDSGPEIVMGYDNPSIQIIRQENVGPGAARNTGLKACAGTYVVFLDADDEFMNDFLKTCMEHLQANPECVLSVVDHFVGVEKTPWLSLKPELDILPQGPWRLPNDTRARAAKSVVDFFQSGAILCLRDVVLKYGGFYENKCTYGEDNYIWLQVILNHTIYIDRRPLIWHHTEDSELGDRRVGGYPPWPKLTDPKPIRDNCPDEYRNFLERSLTYYAILASQRCLQSGDIESARLLMRKYPEMSKWKKEFREIKNKMILKYLRNLIKRLGLIA